MNLKQRGEFWDTLRSLKGESLPDDRERLRQKIILPPFLFRYRAVSANTLNALRTNQLFFSSANYYDDPFDTFLHIDIEQIQTEFERNFSSPEAARQLAGGMQRFMAGHESALPAGLVSAAADVGQLRALFQREIGPFFLSYVLDLRNEVRKDAWSICFSENGFNETLWLKYADQYRGFALVYDLAQADAFDAGERAALYPVHYGNAPYDATCFARYVLGQKLARKMGFPLPPFMEAELRRGVTPWERERIALLKKPCHQYDEEWRMIAGGEGQPEPRQWRPAGVILGLRMGASQEQLTIALAQSAGIPRIYKSFINARHQLDAYPLSG